MKKNKHIGDSFDEYLESRQDRKRVLSSVNKRLNRIAYWKEKKCYQCGRKYPDTIINIEGIIHHKCKEECLDKKDCVRYCKDKGIKRKP